MLIKSGKRDGLFFLSGLLSLIVLSVALAGVLQQGLYHPTTPEEFLPGAMSQDILSILVAISLLACLVLIRRGRELAWLVWAGLVGYLMYAYGIYSFDGVYNPLFLFYVAVFGLCVYSLIGFFAHADVRAVQVRSTEHGPPRIATAILFLLLTAMFLILWMGVLIPAMIARDAPQGNAIFVQDLAIYLPLMTLVAVLLLRKRPLGDALAVPLLVKASTLGLSVLLGTLLAPLYGDPFDLRSVAIYAVLGVGPLLFIPPFLFALHVAQAKRSKT